MKKGDLILIRWVDIWCDPVGDPKDADSCIRTSTGFFQRWDTFEAHGKKIRHLVISPVQDERDEDSSGWEVFPRGCIVETETVRARSRGRRQTPRIRRKA